MVENTASIKVLGKVGMIFDKKAPYEKGTADDIWYKLKKKLITIAKVNFQLTLAETLCNI